MQLTDAGILITGATGGLGSALAMRLAKAGADLLLTGRDPARLTTLAEALRISGTEVRTLAADLCRDADRERLVAVAAEFGIDCLINNAAANGFATFERQSPEDIHRIVATSLETPMMLTRQLLPHLLAQPRAMVVNIGSVFGALPFPGFVAYSVAKAGVRAFSHALRRELAGSAVRVIHIAPRAMATEMNTLAVEAFNRDTKAVTDAPIDVANRIVTAMIRETPETFIGSQEGLAARLNGVVPTLFDRLLKGAAAAARRHAYR